MSTRASNARHVRQRKLNTKQPLRVIRESEVEDALDDESQRQIPLVETGVEKGEEIEHHLQAVISAAASAALGKKAGQVYIPTPETKQADGVPYDNLYHPRAWTDPTTYVRFSSTVEDCIGTPYCMNIEDERFIWKQLNVSIETHGQKRPQKSEPTAECSVDAFEEVMSFLEETSMRVQPFAAFDGSQILSLEEMERSIDENLSLEAQRWMKAVYKYWVSRKGSRPLLPSIKVRILDTSNDTDDADPYVCFRRREVRQTRKTRGRDAQVVEKLKKLRLELEQARQLVQMVNQREQLNKEQLEISREVFEQRRELKKVKVAKGIQSEKGEDEELLINQKPAPKAAPMRRDTQQSGRPATIRLRSGDARSQAAFDDGLIQLSEVHEVALTEVLRQVNEKIQQHHRWNRGWIDRTKQPLTPPPELDETVQQQPEKYAPLIPEDIAAALPSPPPSLRSEGSRYEKGDDIEMPDRRAEAPPHELDAAGGAESSDAYWHVSPHLMPSVEDYRRTGNPACRLRVGRGGRRWLEARPYKPYPTLSAGVVSDPDSDEDDVIMYEVPDRIRFDYRTALNGRARYEAGGYARPSTSGSDAAAAGASSQPQIASGSAG